MKSKQLINERLFEQFEKEGKEVIYTKRGDKKIKARVTDPINKLFQDGFISFEESSTANKYTRDYDLSLCENYAQAILSDLPCGTSEFSFEDKRSQASIRVNDIKILVLHLSSHRQRKLRKKFAERSGGSKLTTFQQVLKYIFESRLSINRLAEASGMDKDSINNRAKEVAKVIYNYYEK